MPQHLRVDHSHRRTVVRVVLLTHVMLALVTAAAVTLAYRHLDGDIRSQDVTGMLTDRPEKQEVEGKGRKACVPYKEAGRGEPRQRDGRALLQRLYVCMYVRMRCMYTR